MAKTLNNDKKKLTTAKEGKKDRAETPKGMITVKDLSEEFGIEAASIRQVIRAAGFKAPKADTPEGTFGPRTKYMWTKDSEELKKIKAAIQAAIDAEKEGPGEDEEDGGEEEPAEESKE